VHGYKILSVCLSSFLSRVAALSCLVSMTGTGRAEGTQKREHKGTCD